MAEVQSSYADDLRELESDPDIACLSNKLNVTLKKVSKWSKRKKLVIAPEKSSVTLFTPEMRQSNVHPQVCIDGKLDP